MLQWCRKIFNLSLSHAEEPADPVVAAGRAEAAAKLTANHEIIMDDILNNSGIVRNRTSLYGGTIFAVNGYPPIPSPAVVKAVDYSLRRVATYLLTGRCSPLWSSLSCTGVLYKFIEGQMMQYAQSAVQSSTT